MKIAIVGTSRLNEHMERDVQQYVNYILDQAKKEHGHDLIVVSGGATGVDTIAEDMAKQKDIDTHIFKPEINEWEPEDGSIGFKARNLQIAEDCDELYCFPTYLFNTSCYHCPSEKHQAGGGCWTAKKAKEKGKEVKVIDPIIR